MTPRRLEYAPRYFRRLEDIRERIVADNPTAASRMIERIRAAVMRLATSPALGRPGRVADTRELVIPRTPSIVLSGQRGRPSDHHHIAQRPAMARQIALNG